MYSKTVLLTCLAVLALLVIVPQAAAQTEVTQDIWECGPPSCPAGWTEVMHWTALPGCPSPQPAYNWIRCTKCGDGFCHSNASVENGAKCGQDCCDSTTSCNQTYKTQGQYYCRSMYDPDLGGWSAWSWLTPAQSNLYCDESVEVCVNKAKCSATTSWCKDPVYVPHWGATCP